MTHSRKKRKERANEERLAELEKGLAIPEVQEALEGQALAAEREAQVVSDATPPEPDVTEPEANDDASLDSETDPSLAENFDLKRVVESVVFASDRPITVAQLRQHLGSHIPRGDIQDALDSLVLDYQDRGMVLHDVAGGYQFRTHPSSSEWVQKFIAGRPVRLSRAQLDTLAIVAYRQPITRPEIDEIRGVDSGGTLRVLLDRNLLRILGKKEEAGRPLLYGTSKDFLEFFNLAELRDLPTLREFHELNEDGLAEVSKLGVDLKGVDVGAVAADVAKEREEARLREEEEERRAAEAETEAAAQDETAAEEEAGPSVEDGVDDGPALEDSEQKDSQTEEAVSV